jgi:D-alanyl-D-alanine carboxypeptidase/D-alanyl-D-alanine-endopeptidase (penicillin-binding protein 4)
MLARPRAAVAASNAASYKLRHQRRRCACQKFQCLGFFDQRLALSNRSPFQRGAARLLRAAAPFLPLFLALPAHAQFKALSALEHSGAQITAEAVDLNSNAVIAELNPELRLTPASLTKLAVTAAALNTWPADKMFRTRLVSAAKIRDGKLEGDLVLQGAGDPSLDDHALWTLAAQLKGAGVTSIAGGLLVNPQPFGIVHCETKDRCDALQRSDTAYNAPLASIGVDFGNWCVDVRPTSPGAAARVQGCGLMKLPIPVDGTIRTVRAGARQTFWVERVTGDDGDHLRVSGDIPEGRGQQVYRAMSNPALGVGQLMAETLREIGVSVAGPVRISSTAPPDDAQTLAQTEGLSLREQLGRMLRFSNNYIADVLTLDLAAAVDRDPPTQLSSAGSVLSDFVARAVRTGRRATTPAPPLLSGSGLTPENRLSARDLVGLLSYQYHDARRFPAFYGGLVVPRDAPFAFLRTGSQAWLDRVALKTGTMDDPRSVCGIAGYMRKRDGGWIAFAIIVNGGPGLHHVPLYRAMEASRSDLDELLKKY